MNRDFQAFLDSLSVMGKGMGGIFIVTGVIIISMYILVSLTGKKNK